MSGQMLLHEPGALDERHLRVRFGLVTPDGRRLEMRFVDQRMFGGLAVSEGGAELPAEIVHIARDPIDPEFDDDEFVRRARRRTSAIKRLLLDQGLISGVGNIYADEALWRAKLHGERPGDRLTGPVLRELLGHVRAVMGEALAQGGTSFDALYVNVNGESGYFDRSLDAYGQEGQPCRRCGTPIRRVVLHEPLVVLLPALPAAAAVARRTRRGVDPPPPRWDSWRRPDRRPDRLHCLRKAPHGQGAVGSCEQRRAHHRRPRRREPPAAPPGRGPRGAGPAPAGRQRPARRRRARTRREVVRTAEDLQPA